LRRFSCDRELSTIEDEHRRDPKSTFILIRETDVWIRQCVPSVLNIVDSPTSVEQRLIECNLTSLFADEQIDGIIPNFRQLIHGFVTSHKDQLKKETVELLSALEEFHEEFVLLWNIRRSFESIQSLLRQMEDIPDPLRLDELIIAKQGDPVRKDYETRRRRELWTILADRQRAYLSSLAAAELRAHNARVAIARDSVERSLALFRTTNERDLKTLRFLPLIVPRGLFAQRDMARAELERLRRDIIPFPSVEENNDVKRLSLAVSDRERRLLQAHKEIAVLEGSEVREKVDAITSAARLGISHLAASGTAFNKAESLKRLLKKPLSVTPAAIAKTLKSWSSEDGNFGQLLTGLKFIAKRQS
jgi:hypothetical protein